MIDNKNMKPSRRKIMRQIKKSFKWCNGSPDGPCNRRGKRNLQNTAYIDQESNYGCHCDKCQKIVDQYWSAMWSDYYGGGIL